MAENLVVVESPAKAETIKKYLGKKFEVLASYGHVRDLPSKGGSAVDPDSNFGMTYTVSDRSTKHVEAIAKALKKASVLYLATDLDREGEAISWHLVEIFRQKNILEGKAIHRVVFNEITESAIKQAIASPRKVSMDLVNAQQARRALDYLVGFNLSPLLWKKIQPKLSAGRVQSPALRLICERESEIEKFVPREYWTIESTLNLDDAAFNSKLIEYDGKKIKQFSVTDSDSAAEIRNKLISAGSGSMLVSKIIRKQRKRNPAPPFITSTLQQEAVRKIGFTAQKTMRIAQQLYEGIEVDEGTVGLITYMRTDSVSLSADAIEELRNYVVSQYGEDQLPATPRVFKTKSKNAQEAHEAIRPTSFKRSPLEIKGHLTEDQFKLYEIIWKRATASQMIHAVIDSVSADFDCGGNGVFRATGSTVKYPGFMRVYFEEEEEVGLSSEKLPPLSEGDKVTFESINANQHFTDPPPRYGEASLVKTLEEFGIGRPSTYATIIATLQQREYVELDNKRFYPTDVGRLVSGFLTNHFSVYVDYEFTAQLEDALDAVSRGERDWLSLLEEFWGPFEETVKTKESVSRKEIQQERSLGAHPTSGKPVFVRMGRYGPYVIIGDVEDEEKPSFHGLPPGTKIHEVTLDQALETTRLPRVLGTKDGIEYSVNRGRFGPYVMYVDKADEALAKKTKKKTRSKAKGKYVSLQDTDDPYTITLDRAVSLVLEKKAADAAKKILSFDDEGIDVLDGRYGPYITNGSKNAKVPKDKEPSDLTLQECEELLAAAPAKRVRKKKAKKQ